MNNLAQSRKDKPMTTPLNPKKHKRVINVTPRPLNPRHDCRVLGKNTILPRAVFMKDGKSTHQGFKCPFCDTYEPLRDGDENYEYA